MDPGRCELTAPTSVPGVPAPPDIHLLQLLPPLLLLAARLERLRHCISAATMLSIQPAIPQFCSSLLLQQHMLVPHSPATSHFQSCSSSSSRCHLLLPLLLLQP